MARRRTYKKRTYRKRYSNNEIDPIAWFIVLLFLFSYMTYNMFIKDNLESIILFLEIFIPILIIIILLIIYYFYKKKKTIEQERIKNTPSLLLDLEKKIKNHNPLKPKEWTNNVEQYYENWLYQYLYNNYYPDLKIQQYKEGSIPDIVINNIAIEIKWPTNMSWLKTIPDKINQYLPKWEYLFIVLFDIKTPKLKYESKKREILENTIESKRDKIFFIEI